MAIFQIDVQKKYGGEYWTNVYYANAASLADAQSFGELVVQQERLFHSPLVIFDKMRVSTITEGDFNYITLPLSGGGSFNFNGDIPAPLFNVLRVDLFDGVKRPSRKYYRTGASAAAMAGDQWGQSLVSAAASAASVLVADGRWTSREGNPILNGVAFGTVAMRQLRRGSRRRLEPVI